MQAFLLATGEGNKLTPLSTTLATPMLPIANRPVMAYSVELLARAGVQESFVSLYQFPASIENYFGNGERWNLQLHYLLQRQPWGDAGALKRMAATRNETILLLPADALIDLDLSAALAFHRQHGGAATAIVSRHHAAAAIVSPPARPLLQLTPQGHIQLPTGAHHASANQDDLASYTATGAYLLEPQALAHIPTGIAFTIQPQLLAALAQAGEATYGYVMAGYWNPLQTFADLQAAQTAYLQGLIGLGQLEQPQTLRYLFAEGYEVRPGVWCGPNSTIHPTARLTPPVYVGAYSRIERDVELGPQVVIGDRTIVDEGATLRESTVLADSYVGRFLHVDQRLIHQELLIDVQSGQYLQIIDPFWLAENDTQLASRVLKQVAERALASLLLLLALPLVLLLGLLVGIATGQWPLVRHTYVGSRPHRGKAQRTTSPQTLTLFRLRTRTEPHTPSALERWLEASELHRLPELWQVVCGELGLVGVKPLTPEEANQVTESWQQKRYDAPAGFTGLWYTATVHPASFEEICILDTYYAATHTWSHKFQQLLYTPRAWWRHLQTRRAVPSTAASTAKAASAYGPLLHPPIGETAARNSRIH
ncbi:MAG: sugar transferase [Caldilineaceae bacterium]|nr:sugar transferase [Caldilineaceae bacterium]